MIQLLFHTHECVFLLSLFMTMTPRTHTTEHSLRKMYSEEELEEQTRPDRIDAQDIMMRVMKRKRTLM